MEIDNKDRRFGEADTYHLLWYRGKAHLATPYDLAKIRERALRNPEDVRGRSSLFRRFLSRLFG
jgi:hypothetical protein